MAEYIVDGKSRKELRFYAKQLRRILKLENELYIPVVELLEILPYVFDNFNYEILPDNECTTDFHAQAEVLTGLITIKESIYLRACDGEGRDRMTIAHEIAHIITLKELGFKVHRNFDNRKIKAFEDPEWQAKCLSGEFMIDYDLTEGMTPSEIVDACGVSFDAANYQYTHRN